MEVKIIPVAEYTHHEQKARKRIPRDPDAWETIVLALEMDAAIWTQDCDFLGCGCPTWITETLTLQLNTEGEV